MVYFKRGGGAGRRGRGRGSDLRRGNGQSNQSHEPCLFYKQGKCKFGGACDFSHDFGYSANQDRVSAQRDRRFEETPEEQYARATYNTWRSLIRRPPLASGLHSMQSLWEGALEILNSDNRDWKQALPKDLDKDEDEGFFGRYHIKALMSKRAQASQYDELIETSRSFLMVMTHSAMVDCLSVDTYVGSLYTFISGANGTRAIPFFQHFCEILMETRTDTARTIPLNKLDSSLIVLSTALSELLRRESRARYNEELPNLINSLDTAAQMITETASVVASSMIARRAGDLGALIFRAHGLLSDEADAEFEAKPTSVLRSTYPRNFVIPGEHHDNDKTDITKIRLFPTRAEILCDEKEFLPSTNPDEPHFLTSKLERHIDTHFRLLRHDTFGKLKDDLGGMMKKIINDSNQLTNPRLDYRDTRTYSYTNSFVSFLLISSRGGFQAQMSFPQPHSLRKGLKTDKRKWWEESRRLEEGVLLSFIWMHGSTIEHLFFTVVERSTDSRKEHSLTHSDRTATITVKLTSQDRPAIEALLDLSRQKTHGILLEFPNVLPATFVPVLENLQRMQGLSRLPFCEWILPDRVNNPSEAKLDVAPPLYARHAGFTFSLNSILRPGASPILLYPSSSGNDPVLVAELEANTELDHGQCVALIAALTREFALIQGPPGTGKSFLGVKLVKVLLDVRRKADLGPIVIVCYTNHALDQFLEHLINTGIRKIIRVGGQSRSILLEDHNLRAITQTEAKSKHEKWQAATAYQNLDECETKSRHILGRLHGLQKRIEWKYFQRHIAKEYSAIHAQFNRVDSEEFTVIGRHPFDIWMHGGVRNDSSGAQPGTALETPETTNVIRKAAKDVNSLSYTERRMLVELWTDELQRKTSEEFFDLINDAENIRRNLTYVHEEINRRVLQEAHVIGLTTSSLAKNISTLQHVKAKVIICEEAGEVMEPHIISALLPSVEHFIQIGDHQQLRPSINNFEDLSLESKQGILYQLDRSQFERLTIGECGRPSMPVAQLNIQRRMRPDISTLIRETIYDRLIDHPTTAQLPDVVGMRKNVFWLDHDNLEDGNRAEIQHNKSQSNDWEVEMVHALVRHVVRQGVYNSSDIAVLTPYTGQLQKLRSMMRNDFEIVVSERDQNALIKDGFGAQDSAEDQVPEEQCNTRKPLEKKQLSDLLRVATVDNFQGEEAKIIIVSLVRSNKDKKVGFLKTTNRINVLLSRAQHGMYLIGNTNTYSNVPMWQKVIDMLHAKDSVGPSLDLCCPRHLHTAIQVQQPDDFARFSPEGGCREACMDRLPDCGHQCQARCHSKAMHEVFRCEKPCQRRHEVCNHACQKPTCGEDCGKCMIVLNNVRLPCHHFKDNVLCYLMQDLEAIQCEIVVDKTIPGCGHTVQVHCYQDVNGDRYRCPVPCGTNLTCGHACPGTCGRCNVKDRQGDPVVEHSKCDKACGRRFGTCNHVCPKRCHDGSDCGLCTSKCEVACKHSRCTLKCHEACAPCVERCTWSCAHQGECKLPCSAPCNRLPCNERCTSLLPCGHQCPGICGENCLPEYCKDCEMKLDAQVDMLEFKDYAEINLDETPVVALGCGHFFTAETLDGMIGLKEVYKIDSVTGKILGLEDISSTMAPAIPKCPHCQLPVRQYVTQRYNRLINRAVINEMSKRFIVTGQTDLQEIEENLTKMDLILENTRPGVTSTKIVTSFPNAFQRAIKEVTKEVTQKLDIRYKACATLRSAVLQLQRRAADRHQPGHKLHEATLHALQQDTLLENALATLRLEHSPPTEMRDERITLRAKTLQAKIEGLILEDSFYILSDVKAKYEVSAATLMMSRRSPLSLTEPFLHFCAELITTCIEKSLPRLAVEVSLYYARIARLFETSGITKPEERQMATKYHDKAQTLLEQAGKLCEQGFREAENLLQAVNESSKLLGKEWYEDITAEELATIKRAMVSGSQGIATHSGHWYNCVNGHPFAIGECGMPMELARCPECGSRIGGQGHQAVQGVSRAQNMEH